MKIEVTQEDIERGTRGHCALCPVARAVKRAMRTEDVWADGVAIVLTRHGDNRLFLDTPDEAICFMEEFDAGEPVEPFSFELEAP